MRTMISFQCDTTEEAIAVIEAVKAIGKEPHACSKKYLEPEELTQTERTVAEKEILDSASVVRKNICPGEPTISKIGASTTGMLLELLRCGIQPDAKYREHLKLLWKRGLVKFDGTLGEYYV